MNLYNIKKAPKNKEITEVLAEHNNTRIERILSAGQRSPEGFWYDSKDTEFVALLAGEATLGYENGERVTLRAGDTLVIPPRIRHRVEYTSKEPVCVWLCVYY